jgi:hypothetical protein
MDDRETHSFSFFILSMEEDERISILFYPRLAEEISESLYRRRFDLSFDMCAVPERQSAVRTGEYPGLD